MEKINNNEMEYSVSEIVEKFKHFKTLLLNLAKTSEVPLNIEGNLLMLMYIYIKKKYLWFHKLFFVSFLLTLCEKNVNGI